MECENYFTYFSLLEIGHVYILDESNQKQINTPYNKHYFFLYL